ncbi:M48 family metallopeptidase [Fundidesulfovibrio putealis]|uniref:M48 family metallopeptidase n=1 Tax=Fundidesulfovibrio putealis TaxID=270496 RepID=UPI000685DA35|nr:SprT family zinc-dependent metalloprotease [Fundidesulfovibrio putealis]
MTTQNATSLSLPPYAHRISPRAKRVRLVITPETGLTVVTPPGFDPGLLAGIVMDRLEWVEHHLERANAARQSPAEPPARVELRAVGRVLSVRYRAGSFTAGRNAQERPGSSRMDGAAAREKDLGGVRVREQGISTLEVAGNIACRDSVMQALRRWLVREGQRVLPPWLESEAARLGLSYSGTSVRLQRTRWGSCSAKGLISLNARLLFLPEEVAGYVLAHELAHTVHLNHSPAYWRFLERLLPGASQLDRALREARRLVPAWARG